MNQTVVTRVASDTAGRTEWEITVQRRPAYERDTNPPLAADLPADVRQAIRDWLDDAEHAERSASDTEGDPR